MAENFYGIDDGLAGGYTADQGGFDQELEDAVTLGRLQAQEEERQIQSDALKINEKKRRLEQTRARKQRDLLGGDSTDYGSDSLFTRKAKEFVNEILPHDYQIPVDRNGKQYTTANKTFNSEDLANIWKDTKEDPNGDSVLYYVRKEDGYNDDGSKKWIYKPGIAKHGAMDRYKNQLGQDGWELIGEKRTNNAEQVENMIHGNEAFLKERTFDYGTTSQNPDDETKAYNEFGAGKSELYNKDILGIDDLDTKTQAQKDARKILSIDNRAAYKKKIAQDPDGKFGNLIDALQSRAVSTGAGMLDAVYDVFSDDEHNALNKWKDTQHTDKLFGYNARTSASGLDKAAWDFENGNYLNMLGNAFSVAPELIAESLPEMGAMMSGYGLGAITAMRANDVMDDILENNDGKISAGERMQAIAAGTMMTALDRFGLDQMIAKNAMGKTLVKKIFDNSGEQASKSVARKLIEKTAQLSVAGSAEAGTEMLQEITEAYGGKFGTKAEDELWNDEMKDAILKAGLGGFSAGSTMRAGADVVQSVVPDKKTDAEREVRTPLDTKMREIEAGREASEGSPEPLTEEERAEVATLLANQIEAAKQPGDNKNRLRLLEDALVAMESSIGSEIFGENQEASINELKAEIDVIQKQIKEESLDSVATEDEVSPEESTLDETIDMDAEEARLDAIEAEEDLKDSIQAVADKIIAGEELTTEDLQVQQNEGKAIEAILKAAKTESKSDTLDKKIEDFANRINPKKPEKTIKEKTLAKVETLRKEALDKASGKAEIDKINAKHDRMRDSIIRAHTETDTKSETPGPLRAFANRFKGILVQKIKEAKATAPKFKKRIKNAAGKLVEVAAGKRKTEKRVSEPLESDTDFVNTFMEGSRSEKVQNNAKANKKQLSVLSQSKLARAHKVTLVEKVKNLVKSDTLSEDKNVNSDFDALFTDPDNSKNEGGALRLAIAGLHHVIEDIKSNVDRTNKAGFVNETLYASRQNIAKEIGRTFVSSYGHNLVAEKGQNSDEAIDRHYIEIGNVAIAMLKEMGYIEHYEGNEGFADTGFQEIVTEDNTRIETEKTTVNKQEVPKISGDNIIILKEDLVNIKGKKTNKTSKSVNSSLSEMLSPIMAVMNPGNKRDPQHEPDDSDIEGKDHTVSDNFNNIVKEIADKPMYIKPDTLALLQEIVKLTKNKSLDELIKDGKHNWIKTMFDLDKKDDVLATERNSVSGKYTSRIGNAMAIIQAVSDSTNEAGEVDVSKLFYTYFSAVNQRIHIDEISFNFQADNYFTRHILSPVEGSYETSTAAENQTLILAVAEELGINPADVMSDTGNYEEDSAEDGMNVILGLNESDNLKWLLDPRQIKDEQFSEFFGSSKSPNSAIKALQAVKAIREAIQAADGDWKKAKIKSNYAVEFDGNTSGLVNKLLNMLGSSATHDQLFAIVQSLTVADENGKLGDGYNLLTTKVIELLEARIEKAKDSRRKKDKKQVESIKKLIEFINTTKGAMRLVSKEPMMTNIYGQMEESLSRGLGLSMSGQLLESAKIGSKNQKEAMDTIEILFKRINSSHDMDLSDKREMADTIGDLLGGIFAEALSDINKDLDESTEPIYRSYKLLQNISKYLPDFSLEMRSPFDVTWAALYPESAEKGAMGTEFNFPITKKKIVAVGESIVGTGTGSVLPTQEQFMPNQNSQRVMPLHAIDTAILLLAYEGTLRALGYVEGSMPIHDAVYSTPAFMNEYKKQYNKAAIDVAREYDLINETSIQIERAIKELEGVDGTTVLRSELDKINQEINKDKDERLKRKGEALDVLAENAEVFGTFKNKLDDGIVEQKADPKPRPKPKPTPVATETKSGQTESTVKSEPTQEELDILNSVFGGNMYQEILDENSAKIMTEFMTEMQKEKRDTGRAIALLESLTEFVTNDSIQHINTLKGFLEADGKTKVGDDFEYIPENDTVIIETGEVKNANDLLKYLAHEVEHRSTSQYLFEQSNKTSEQQDPAYKFAKRVAERMTKMSKDKIDALILKYDTEVDSYGQNVGKRIDYIYSQVDEYHQMAEFVAIYRTNPEFRDMINKEIMPSKSVMNRFIQSVRQIVNSAMRRFTQNGDIAELTMNSLNDAMHDIVAIGHQRRLDVLSEGKKQTAGKVKAKKQNPVQMIDETLEYKPYKGVEPLFFLPIETVIGTMNNHIKSAINMGVIQPGSKLIESDWVQAYHKKGMSRTEGMYYRTVNMIHEITEPGTLLSRILVDMQLTEGFDYEKISQLHTIWNKAQQARNQIDSDMLVKSKEAYDKLTKKYSEAEKDSINSLFNRSLIHVLAESDTGTQIIDEVLKATDKQAEVAKQIAKLQAELTNGTSKIMDDTFIQYGVGKLAKDIASFYHDGRLGNLAESKISSHYVMKTLGQDKLHKFNQLTALYQLQYENLDTLAKFKKDSLAKGNEDMYKEFMYVSRANATISIDADQDLQGNNQYKFDSATGSHVLFEENYEFKTVNMNKFENLIEDEENKWIILQKPNPALKQLGLVARIRDDFGTQPGIVSHTNLNSDGVPVTKDDLGNSDLKISNIMQSGVGGQYEYKIMLTNEMLSKLQVRKNASSSLYRSYGHNKEIVEGKSALKHILENESVIVKDTKDAAKLEKMLKAGNKPMFLKLSLDTLTKEDYPLIYRHYVKTQNLTNVLGFNRRVNMVHKDLQDQFVGYTKAPMFDKRHVQLRKGEQILRDAITMLKGHVVMGNPAKIAMDAMSNTSILLANNVPLKSMAKYGKEAADLAPKLVLLRNEVILLEMELDGTPTGTKEHTDLMNKVKKGKEKIKNHPFAAALNNGFIQSLSTSMMMKDKETMGGLQKRLNSLFQRIDDVPAAKKAIFYLAKKGLNIEDVLDFAAKGTKDGAPLDRELKHIADKFRRIKNEKDTAAYLSEFVASPSQSELLRLGGVATLGVDLISKWVLYKHTMDELSSDKTLTQAQKEERAVSLALNSFVDYRRNLPRELDFLSDVGVFMFPQFTLRIQKVIWALAYNKAIGSGTGVASAMLSGHMNASIFGSAIPLKTPAHIDGFDANMVYPASFF